MSFTYDDAGNRLTMTDGTGTTDFTYDNLNRPTFISDGAANVVGYGYDAAGRRTSITYPGSTGTVTYGYDDANRLTSVTDWLSMATSYTYDAANRLTSTTLGNGLISDRTYDDSNRLLTLVNRDGLTTISSYTYTLDNVGNRSQVVDTTGTTTYGYDGLYRLTGVTYPNLDVQSYTYDAMGNRLTRVQNSVPTTYTYDDAGQMTAAGATAYTYDGDGNTTAAGADAYAWDAENRLVGTTIGGVTSTYAYNGAGLRTSRTIGGVTTTYAWDLTGSLPEVLQDNAGNKYVYALDLISKTNGTTQEYYLTDGLGSTTGITDGSGNVTGTYAYDAFGAVRSQTGATTEWSYTGEQNDPTGLEYLRARYYDANTGRFLSQDPMPLLQRYAYAYDNPANLVDLSGLDAGKDRFDQLMDAERAAQAWAKQILADPCWKTHAFCLHVPLNWKKVGAYAKACAIWGLSGAAIGFVGTGLDPAGALAGGIAGCAAGMFSHYATETLSSRNPFLQALNQCTTWGAAAGSVAIVTGGGAVGAAAAGCAAGSLSFLDSYYHISERLAGDSSLGPCAEWGGASAASTPGGPAPKIAAGVFGCAAGFLSDRSGS